MNAFKTFYDNIFGLQGTAKQERMKPAFQITIFTSITYFWFYVHMCVLIFSTIWEITKDDK